VPAWGAGGVCFGYGLFGLDEPIGCAVDDAAGAEIVAMAGDAADDEVAAGAVYEADDAAVLQYAMRGECRLIPIVAVDVVNAGVVILVNSGGVADPVSPGGRSLFNRIPILFAVGGGGEAAVSVDSQGAFGVIGGLIAGALLLGKLGIFECEYFVDGFHTVTLLLFVYPFYPIIAHRCGFFKAGADFAVSFSPLTTWCGSSIIVLKT